MMKKMLYVSELNANLLFISTFNRREFVVIFNEKSVEIRNKNTLIVIEIAKGRMYMLQSISTTLLSNETKIPKKIEKTITSDIILEKKRQNIIFEKKGQAIFRLWHERLEHVKSTRLKMLSMQMLSMNAINISDDFDCKICNLFKLTRKVNREIQKRAFRKLERVHTNV